MKEINGDNKLNLKNKILYFLINSRKLININKTKIKSSSYKVNNFDNLLLNNNPSPSRYLQNYYIKNEIKNFNKKIINVLDVGCGNSEVCKLLELSGLNGNYTGLDIKNYYDNNLGKNNFNKKFIQADIIKKNFDEEFDLIISNSVMEHIKNDKFVFNKLQKNLNLDGFQIHLVPSRFSLFLYLFHGWRQYSLLEVEQKLGDKVEVIFLGGVFTFLLHLGFITLPNLIFKIDLRKKFSNLYSFLLQKNIFLDRYLPFLFTTIIIKQYAK